MDNLRKENIDMKTFLIFLAQNNYLSLNQVNSTGNGNV